jgi:hypothetical protein
MAINEITITEERSRVIDFSVPYFDANQGFLIEKGGPAEGVSSIAEMTDLLFGFQAATTGGEYIQNEIQPDEDPREFITLGAATQALANGQIDAFLMDVAMGSPIGSSARRARSARWPSCGASWRPAGRRISRRERRAGRPWSRAGEPERPRPGAPAATLRRAEELELAVAGFQGRPGARGPFFPRASRPSWCAPLSVVAWSVGGDHLAQPRD